ncbi:FtsX-like permease family protein [Corynebacterium occultum]|uniref:FtsX-like permease family protein n=1 Tax=Corynebacterium occultum TaxID=2675219 RepID=A0A6B8VRI9_9CORY|nr:FtsX-like permease family protein [Corynebacterium occultum]QGU06733.1 FtsX-like permease family protein [Corynebacterium occultum]
MSTLRAATRPTRRDVRQNLWQSLAAILLVALPVIFFSAVFLSNSSTFAAQSLAETRTTVTYGGGTCTQSVAGYTANCSGDGVAPADTTQQELLTAALPEGFRAQLQVQNYLQVSHGERSEWLTISQVTPEVDRAPARGEILLPRSLSERLQVEVGDTLILDAASGEISLRIGGFTPSQSALVVEPTLLDSATFGSAEEGTMQWGVTGPRNVTWEDVELLNAAGFVVYSQDVVENPPPPGTALEDDSMYVGNPFSNAVAVTLTLIGVLVIAFLVLVVISPVFTISVGRQSRIFALMASQGATPWHIRWAVLVYGLFAGVAGAGLGLVVGALGFVLWWLQRYPEWPIVVPWWELAAIWGFAVVAATVAAFLPAVVASRASIIAGAHGAAPDRMMRWRPWMLLGPVLLSLGLVLLLSSQLLSRGVPYFLLGVRELLIGFSVLAGVIGAALCAPTVVWVLGRIRNPLALRLAGRDLRRQSLRSIPAVAAIAAVVTIGTVVIVSQETSARFYAHQAAEAYQPGSIFIQGAGGLSQAVSALEQVVDIRAYEELHGLSLGDDFSSYTSLVDVPADRVREECDELEPESTACQRMWANNFVPGPAAQLGAVALIPAPTLLETFNTPVELPEGAVMLVPGDVSATEATFEIVNQGSFGKETLGESVTLPLAAVLPTGLEEWLPTAAAFEQFAVDQELVGAVVIAERNLTQRELREVNAELEATGTWVHSPVATPDFWDSDLWFRAVLGMIVLLIAALVLLLSVARTRRQNTLLAAVGAPPQLLKTVNAYFGGLITLAGSLLGLLLGHVGVLLASSRREVDPVSGILLDPGRMQHVQPDWQLLLVLLIIVPAGATVLGWYLSPRSRLGEYRTS